jgi:plasmid stabilization system protein ParE
MTLRTIVEQDAKKDLVSARDWYQNKEAGLEKAFLQDLESTLNRIVSDPFASAIVFSNIRQRRLSRFPYVVSYILKADAVHVIAVLHGHRDPQVWQERPESN